MSTTANNNTVNISVPENMVEQMRLYMEQLRVANIMTDETPMENNMSMETETTPMEAETSQKRLCEVKRISDHACDKDGNFDFKIHFKGIKEPEWVKDSECQCEETISEYLASKGISTAYLFCRVSSKEQAQSTNVSLSAQEAELRKAAKTMSMFSGMRIRVYSISHSAYRKIPETLCRIGKVSLPGDIIMVWRVDRLSRNIFHYLQWCEELNDRGVSLYSHQEQITYRDNKLSFTQAILDANKEAELLGKRVKLANKHKLERGDHRIGNLPYGKRYKRVLNPDGSTHHKEVEDHPEEQAVILRVRREVAQNYNLHNVIKKFDKEGISKRGRKFTVNMLVNCAKQYY